MELKYGKYGLRSALSTVSPDKKKIELKKQLKLLLVGLEGNSKFKKKARKVRLWLPPRKSTTLMRKLMLKQMCRRMRRLVLMWMHWSKVERLSALIRVATPLCSRLFKTPSLMARSKANRRQMTKPRKRRIKKVPKKRTKTLHPENLTQCPSLMSNLPFSSRQNQLNRLDWTTQSNLTHSQKRLLRLT